MSRRHVFAPRGGSDQCSATWLSGETGQPTVCGWQEFDEIHQVAAERRPVNDRVDALAGRMHDVEERHRATRIAVADLAQQVASLGAGLAAGDLAEEEALGRKLAERNQQIVDLMAERHELGVHRADLIAERDALAGKVRTRYAEITEQNELLDQIRAERDTARRDGARLIDTLDADLREARRQNASINAEVAGLRLVVEHLAASRSEIAAERDELAAERDELGEKLFRRSREAIHAAVTRCLPVDTELWIGEKARSIIADNVIDTLDEGPDAGKVSDD